MNAEPKNEAKALSLIQPDISGGRIDRQTIDSIGEYPRAEEISISGLTQETFEYFIRTYARQFKTIKFWKCPLVGDFQPIEGLSGVEYIDYFWNQRAAKFWDFSKTRNLKKFCFYDFTRLPDLSSLASASSLVELRFGDLIWSKLVVQSLEPLSGLTGLKKLVFSAKSIVDKRIEPLAGLSGLEELSFPANVFTTVQVAWLKAKLPGTVKSRELNAFFSTKNALEVDGKSKNVIIVGKGKPFLDPVADAEKIKRYADRFAALVAWFLKNPGASPEDWEDESGAIPVSAPRPDSSLRRAELAGRPLKVRSSGKCPARPRIRGR